jgi:hypothetical protein
MARRFFDVPHTTEVSDGKGNVFYRYKAKRLDQQARVVCAACNNGWMRRLEDDNRDVLIALIEGTSITLDATQQDRLEAWAIKTVMVHEYTMPKSIDRYFKATERAAFRREPHPTPAETDVFLTDYRGIRYPFLSRRVDRRLHSIAGPKPGERGFPGTGATLLFGRMILDVRSRRCQEMTGRPSLDASWETSLKFASLLRMHPTVTFPHAVGVDDGTIDEFTIGRIDISQPTAQSGVAVE